VRFDAGSAECLVLTFREGLLSAVGHDLVLRVSELTIDIDGDDRVSARLGAGSLRVTSPVSPSDARDIERHAARDVLDAARHPSVDFASTRVTRDGERARVEGTLRLHGVTRPIAFDAVADASHWRAEVRLDQRQFDIRPYSALLGTLKVKPEVLVRVAVPRW
jgi:polyisoprenoid-binding protein YceI